MLSSRTATSYKHPGILIRLLLLKRQVLSAMRIAAALLEVHNMFDINSDRTFIGTNHAALVFAKRYNSGEDFFMAATQISGRFQLEMKTTLTRQTTLLQSLKEFLWKWDPRWMQRLSFSTSLEQKLIRSCDEVELVRLKTTSVRKMLQRRPSWLATSILDNTLQH